MSPCRSKLRATLKRNYQLMPALRWLRRLMDHIPDKYEYLVRYYDDYSNRSRGARRLAEYIDDLAVITVVDHSPVDTRRKASWARLIQKVYEVEPLTRGFSVQCWCASGFIFQRVTGAFVA